MEENSLKINIKNGSGNVQDMAEDKCELQLTIESFSSIAQEQFDNDLPVVTISVPDRRDAESEEDIECIYCSFRSKSATGVQRHLEEKHICEVCQDIYEVKKDLMKHKRFAHKQVKCLFCSKHFPSELNMFKHIKDVHREPQARRAIPHHTPGSATNPLSSYVKFPSKKLTKTPSALGSASASTSASASAGIIPLEDILNYYNHGQKTAALANSAYFTSGVKPTKSLISPSIIEYPAKPIVPDLFRATDLQQSLDTANFPVPTEPEPSDSKSRAPVSYNGYFKDFKNITSFSVGSEQFRHNEENKWHPRPLKHSADSDKTVSTVKKMRVDTADVENGMVKFKVSGLERVTSVENMPSVPQFTYYPKSTQRKACKTIYLDEDPWDSRSVEAAPDMIPMLQREKENQGLKDLNRMLRVPLAKPECIPDLTQQIDNLLDDIEKESKELKEVDSEMIIQIKEEVEDDTYSFKDKIDQYDEKVNKSVTEDIDFSRHITSQSVTKKNILHSEDDIDMPVITQSHDLARPILIKEEIDRGVNSDNFLMNLNCDWTETDVSGNQCNSDTCKTPSMEKDSTNRLLVSKKEFYLDIPMPDKVSGESVKGDKVNNDNDLDTVMIKESGQDRSKKRKLNSKRPLRERFILAKSEKLESECIFGEKIPPRPKCDENVDVPAMNDKKKKTDISKLGSLVSKKKSYVDKKLAKVPDKNPYAKEAKSFRRTSKGVAEEINVDIDTEVRENIRQSLQEPYCTICAMLLDQNAGLENSHIEELETRIPKQSVVWVTQLFRKAEGALSSDSSAFPTSPLLSCTRCKVCVHAACYLSEGAGVQGQDWVCDRCDSLSLMSEKAILCVLCNKSGGALKKNGNDVFYHLRCAVLVPELSRSREFDLSCIPSKRWTLSCIICDQVGKELSVHCMASKGCMLSFHLSCAFTNKVDCALGPENSVILRCTFCLEKFKLNEEARPEKKFPLQDIDVGEKVKVLNQRGVRVGKVVGVDTEPVLAIAFDDGTFCDSVEKKDVRFLNNTSPTAGNNYPTNTPVEVKWEGVMYSGVFKETNIIYWYRVKVAKQSEPLELLRSDLQKIEAISE